jgi:hypothetical protein
MTSTAAALLMDRLGLAEDELCRVLGVDPLTVIAGDLDDKPQLPILLALTGEAVERVGDDVLRRWLRSGGPGGRPVDHLLGGDFPAFENDLATLERRGFVLRGGGSGGERGGSGGEGGGSGGEERGAGGGTDDRGDGRSRDAPAP